MRGTIRFYTSVGIEIQDAEGKEYKGYLKNPENPLESINAEGDINELSNIVARTFGCLIEDKFGIITFKSASLVIKEARLVLNNDKLGEYVSHCTRRLGDGGYIRVDYTDVNSPDNVWSSSLGRFVKLIDETFADLIFTGVKEECGELLEEIKEIECELSRKLRTKRNHLGQIRDFLKSQSGDADVPSQRP